MLVAGWAAKARKALDPHCGPLRWVARAAAADPRSACPFCVPAGISYSSVQCVGE